MPELTAETKQLIDKTADLEMEQSTNKKQYYARVMDQLEIDGWPKAEISTVGKNLVETRLWEKYYQKRTYPEKCIIPKVVYTSQSIPPSILGTFF